MILVFVSISLLVQINIHMRDKAATRPDTKHSEEAHQPSSPLKAASSNLKVNYHVFLSFRGMDIQNNFLGHLYAALDQKGIYTYIDSEELQKGEQITPALIKAIENSCIAIIVFSKDYAFSPWCLEEVEKIMECKEQRGLMVFPLFYKVEPKEVRTPRGSYQKAMVEHESKFGRDSEKVKRWKKALYNAGSLSGWDLNDNDEADSIKSIVREISMQLNQTPLYVAKHPVGLCSRVVELESMLNLESHDVLMIGLWGQEETSKDSKDLAHLQEKLLSEILPGKGLTVFSVDGEDLEALELFNKHAFLTSKEKVIRRDLVDSALHYANGLPLALKVLGYFLCGRRE
ncbi:disease resistance protein RPV1 [Eucalyptus grandis]|uniref:disease resistance protein RPV1 n=1 Tax=Eucalyptus grandis TaxID=71139 RepID=UPI00192EBBD1|nr:disease resistance protein RPV1 [Eucalyptus grandis]